MVKATVTASVPRTTWEADVPVTDLLPHSLYSGDAKIDVPPWAFRPDQWTVAFLRGLTKLASGWSGLDVWEVGVGTGINLIALASVAPYTKFYFSDFDPRCTMLAQRHIDYAVPDPNKNYRALHGAWDLVTPPDSCEAPKVDVVIACIPQVPVEIDLGEADNLAHYYCPHRYPNSHLHPCGLGLVEALLDRARGIVGKGGWVVLNLGGRPGISRLEAMFEEYGYRSRVIHEETVAQHSKTSLASLAALEAHGHAHFEFFSDQHTCSGISAEIAETRRLLGRPVFHKIYVIEGTVM
jgi:methylase of polypeptide subunit release factors